MLLSSLRHTRLARPSSAIRPLLSTMTFSTPPSPFLPPHQPPPPQHQQQQQRRSISVYGYEQAKALVYSAHGEPRDVLRLQPHSLSPAHSSLITLRFLAAPINPADINTLQGVYPSKPPFTTQLSSADPIAVPGNEGVAEVISTGSSAAYVDPVTGASTKYAKGDWVIMRGPGFGTWRTHAQGDADASKGLFLRLGNEEERKGVTAIQAGTVSVNPCTAYAMLKGYVGSGERVNEGVKAGEWFVQNGANSGVGRAGIQLAREWGVKSLNVIRARPGGEAETEKLMEELKSLGATEVVTEEEATDKAFPQRVKEMTKGAKVTLGLNCVGGRSALNLSKVLDSGAWLLTYGAMAKQPLSIPAGMLIFKDLRFGGFWVSKWSDNCIREKAEAVQEILQLTSEGKFADAPIQEVEWNWKTEESVLKEAVQGTLEGFRSGKGVFIFKDT